ncbi:MAG: replicative DNA helicase [Elusimicrobiota bacterium]
MADIFNHVPPHSEEAEMAVLGSMMIERAAIDKVIALLKDVSFYKPGHQIVFRAIRRLYESNIAVDIQTVGEELKKEKKLADIGGAAYLMTLIESVATAANVEDYALIVRDKSTLRGLIDVSHEMLADAYKDESGAQAVIEQAEQRIFKIRNEGFQSGFIGINELMPPVLDQVESYIQNKKDGLGLMTGFPKFDRLTGGLQKGNLIIIAGRPGMGKTSWCLNIVENIALHSKRPVAVFTMEMSKNEIAQRFLCSVAKINMNKLRDNRVSRSAWPDITTAASKLMEAKIFINELPSGTLLDLRAQARRVVSEQKVELIVVDYMQLLSSGTKRMEGRQQEISDISRSLKLLARYLEIPIVVVSQLSRKPEERGKDNEPKLSDLRESGAIEQDADVVGFVYREDYYNKEDQSIRGKARLIIAKQRNGPQGTQDMVFFSEYTRFENAETRQQEQEQ